MRPSANSAWIVAVLVFGVVCGQLRAADPIHKAAYIGPDGGEWDDADVWRDLFSNSTGNAATILGRDGGSNGMNNIDSTLTHARDVTIPAGTTVNYHGNRIGDLRWNRGSTLTIENGAVWQQVTDGTYTENSWTQFDSKMILDGGTFRRSVAEPTQADDGGGLILFGSYRDDENLERLGPPPQVSVEIKNGGSLENNGQLWFGADDEHSADLVVSYTINDGTIDLTGGTTPYQNSTLVVQADWAMFYDYYEPDAAAEAAGLVARPQNEQYEINFIGPGSITVDSAGVWVYEQDEFGIWNEGSAGPLSYEDLWNMGILKAHGLSGATGVVANAISGFKNLQPATFSDFFTVSGTPGTDDYTLTSNVTTLQNVEYIGGDGGEWDDADAWQNTTTSTIGDAATILGRAGGSNGMNTTDLATTHARHVTIPAGTTVNYHGNRIGDLRWNRGSVLNIEPDAVWQQVTDGTYTENSWTQFDGTMIIDGGTFRRSVAEPTQADDGGGLILFGSYRDDENLERLGSPPQVKVDIKNGGSLENNGQLWFGADDEHSPDLKVSFTIDDGSMDLTGGTTPYQNSTLVVQADWAMFYDYYEPDAAAEAAGLEARPQDEQYEVNFIGPGSITVDSAGIWVYEQDEFGIWNEGSAGPLSYEDLWDMGILKAHGLSGATGVVANAISGFKNLQPANFGDYFSVTGSPGMDDYILTSLITAHPDVVGLDGDYNDDGVVNAADYVVWRNNEGTNNVLPNDPVGGTIGSEQYDQWVANFGNTAGAGAGVASGVVPEPAAGLMLLLAGIVAALSRKRPLAA